MFVINTNYFKNLFQELGISQICLTSLNTKVFNYVGNNNN